MKSTVRQKLKLINAIRSTMLLTAGNLQVRYRFGSTDDSSVYPVNLVKHQLSGELSVHWNSFIKHQKLFSKDFLLKILR